MLNWVKQLFGLNDRAPSIIKSEKPNTGADLIVETDLAAIDFKSKGDTFLDQGNWENAARCYRQVIASKPDSASAHNNLALALIELRNDEAAVKHLEIAVSLNPKSFNAFYMLGNIARQQGKLNEAVDYFEKAIAVKPDFAEALDYLGFLYREHGQLQQSIEYYRRALSINPLLHETYSSLLFTLQFDETLSSEELYAEHRRFAECFETPLIDSAKRHANDKTPHRRLKIGYLSADFKCHSVALFMLPLLANHDHEQFEVVCYFDHAISDEFTEQFVRLADKFTRCAMMSDDELCAQIRTDEIDILIDLAGHTAHNRLLTFARKPAPIQVTYLGYVNTTGLVSMDYRISHVDTDPPGNECYYTEKLIRFTDHLWWAYRPAAGLPDVSPLPALANGFITFSSSNQISKISPSMLDIWADILHAVPNSRLVLMGISSDVARASFRQQFAANGIDVPRLTFHSMLHLDEFRKILLDTDISLDTFPYNGGTTTCETLWLGLPLISLTGESFVSRMGYAILKELDLPELAARSASEYVDIAVELAGNLARLASLRQSMRERLKSSTLTDEKRFTKGLEAAYREMWLKYVSDSTAT